VENVILLCASICACSGRKLELFCCINTAFVYLSEDSIDIRCTEFPDFSEEFRQIIKAGWLDKTPPKG